MEQIREQQVVSGKAIEGLSEGLLQRAFAGGELSIILFIQLGVSMKSLKKDEKNLIYLRRFPMRLSLRVSLPSGFLIDPGFNPSFFSKAPTVQSFLVFLCSVILSPKNNCIGQ